MLTVIIPVYKVENTFDRCVESIIGQTYSQLEIILVDDGSPDSCPEMCEQWAKRDTRIKVIHKENGGLSSARNAALDIAQGEYITFVDSDDYIDRNTYINVMKNFTTDVDIVEYPIWKFYGSKKQYKIYFNNTIYNNYYEYWINEKAYEHSYVCNKIYRRCIFEKVRFPVGKVFEDIYTVPFLLKKANAIKTINTGLYYYCDNSKSITNTSGGEGLNQLLNANLKHFAPIINENYYIFVLNIQIDVCRLTGNKPIINSLNIKNPWNHGFKNGIKLYILNIIGLKAMCNIYRTIYKIRKKL